MMPTAVLQLLIAF